MLLEIVMVLLIILSIGLIIYCSWLTYIAGYRAGIAYMHSIAPTEEEE